MRERVNFGTTKDAIEMRFLCCGTPTGHSLPSYIYSSLYIILTGGPGISSLDIVRHSPGRVWSPTDTVEEEEVAQLSPPMELFTIFHSNKLTAALLPDNLGLYI